MYVLAVNYAREIYRRSRNLSYCLKIELLGKSNPNKKLKILQIGEGVIEVLAAAGDFFYLVYTFRTNINITNLIDQEIAAELVLSQIIFDIVILIECFQCEHLNYNNLREFLGVEIVPMALPYLPLKNKSFEKLISRLGLIRSTNLESRSHYLSSHYLSTRVISEVFLET